MDAQNIHKSCFWLGALLVSLLFSNCSNTRYLAKDEVLYTGTYISVQSPKKIKNKNELEAELQRLASPKPNHRFFNWLAIRLWVYNKTKNAEKRIGKWLQESFAEEPVLYNESDVEVSKERMENYLFKNGYFVNEVAAFPDIDKQKAVVDYKVNLNHQYTFGKIDYPLSKRGIDRVVNFYKNESLMKKGVPFSINALNEERERITADARNNGYFRFAKDYIFFEFDSTKNNYQVDVTLKINDVDSVTQHRKSYLREIKIYADHTPKNQNQIAVDSVKFGNIQYYFRNDIVNYNTLKEAILFKKGQAYKTDTYNASINQLINLGIYKFVNIQIEPYQAENFDSLDATIYLTTKDKIEFEADLEINSRINSEEQISLQNTNLGSAVALSHNNLNVFGGAERMVVSLLGGIEFQSLTFNTDSLINAFELNTQSSLIIPRFWLPFRNNFDLSRLTPKTVFGLSAGYFNTRFFDNLNFNANYGYQWSNTLKRQHRLKPISVSYFNYFNESAVFISELQSNEALARSFDRLLLFGTEYSYIYNSILEQDQKNYFYIKGDIELIGNLLNSFINTDDAGDKKLFGVKTAQFVKFDGEARYYRIFSKRHLLATRAIAGLGIPFGNSSVLPNSRQYYVGGTNSLRAFKIRTVGPGLDFIENDSSNAFANQTGEIKLEANVEYRFDIAKYLEGAMFLDMGNIWNIGNESDLGNQPDQNFIFNRFLSDIAVGTGVGLRLDFSYFIIRADLGIPLRKQWDIDNNEGFKWITANRFVILNSSEHFVLNLAIGYPF